MLRRCRDEPEGKERHRPWCVGGRHWLQKQAIRREVQQRGRDVAFGELRLAAEGEVMGVARCERSLEAVKALAAELGDAFSTAFHDAFGTTSPTSVFDTVVMGRGTFEPAIQAGLADPDSHLDTYVYSSTLDLAECPDVTVVARTRSLTCVN